MNGQRSRRDIAPQGFLVRWFIFTIAIGGVLLATPLSSQSGSWTSPRVALFTATSATCVTGLTVVDTGSAFSPFGQTVILAMIQAGGIGIMTLATFFLILVGRRLRLEHEFVLTDALGQERIRGLRSLVRRTLCFTILIETAGASVIAARLVHRYGFRVGEALYHGLFHSVSAFCNAGFALYPDSLARFRGDPVLLGTVAVLIVLGGLGFLVLYEAAGRPFWSRRRWSLHARIVLVSTGALILGGTVAFLALEWNNTLRGMPWAERIMTALFHAVTPRTAGFTLLDLSRLRPVTLFFTMALMFIGGSPGSTAGGIKTTTVAVLILTVRGIIVGRPHTECGSRTVPVPVVREAISIFILGVACVGIFAAVLLLVEHPGSAPTDGLPVDALLFEAVSAVGTVGLSAGITARLSLLSQGALMLAMLMGRLGPLTIALTVGRREPAARGVRYPEEEVVVG